MLIFDLDGTLWNTLNITEKVAKEVVFSCPDINDFDINVVRNGMGLSFEENAKKYFPNLEKTKSEKYLKEINDRTIEFIKSNGADIYNGVYEVIKQLSKFYKLGIITNNNNDYIKSFYKTSNLENYFVDYIGTASFGISKADAIKIMVDRNNAINNWYIGDIKKDMLAAQEANVGFIHAKYGFEEELNCKYYINNINEILKLLHDIKYN